MKYPTDSFFMEITRSNLAHGIFDIQKTEHNEDQGIRNVF